MHDFVERCLAFVLILTLLVGFAWLAGFTPDGILCGHWSDSDDHPTNWYDTNLPPDAK